MKNTQVLYRGKRPDMTDTLREELYKFTSDKHRGLMTTEDLRTLRRLLEKQLWANRLISSIKNVLSKTVTRESTEKVLEYLIGDINNTNLFGTILGFAKKSNNKFSFFLYILHETGRIERILFNPCSTSDLNLNYEDLKSYVIIKNDEKLFTEDSNQNIASEKAENIYDNFQKVVSTHYPLNLLNLDILNDGNLNKVFFDSFIIELMRDYLWTFSSFHITDMRFLKQNTNPIYQDKFKDVPYSVGCGDINLKELENFHNSKKLTTPLSDFAQNFKCFKAWKFIDYNYLQNNSQDNLLSINLPKNFNWKTTNFILNKYNFRGVNIPSSNIPQLIKDVKTFINSRTITDRDDLIIKVAKFNSRSYNKIMNIYTNGKYNPNMNNKNISLDIKATTKRFEMLD